MARGQWPCLECSSEDTTLQFDCSRASLSFCLAVTSPSDELHFQASSASGSDTSSNDLERPLQEVLWYNIYRHSEGCLSCRLGIVEGEGENSVETWGVEILLEFRTW